MLYANFRFGEIVFVSFLQRDLLNCIHQCGLSVWYSNTDKEFIIAYLLWRIFCDHTDDTAHAGNAVLN
jgi:hypothetical protein